MLYVVFAAIRSAIEATKSKRQRTADHTSFRAWKKPWILGNISPSCPLFLLAGEAGWLAKFADSLAASPLLTPTIFSAITGRQIQYHF